MDSTLSLLPQDEPAGPLFLGLFLRRLPQDCEITSPLGSLTPPSDGGDG